MNGKNGKTKLVPTQFNQKKKKKKFDRKIGESEEKNFKLVNFFSSN